jgi:hypothetical protein
MIRNLSRIAVWHSCAALITTAFAMAVRADPSISDAAWEPADPFIIFTMPLPSPSTRVGTTPDSVSSELDPFAEGSRYWSVATGSSHDKSVAQVRLTQIHLNQYLVDDLALVYGGMFGYIDAQRTPGGLLAGPELGARWHGIKGKRWSIYLEGLVGAVIQEHPLTEHSLRFNFDLQPGGGGTYRLGHSLLLQAGFRWHHLSNARIRGKARNLGYDAPLLSIQCLMAF